MTYLTKIVVDNKKNYKKLEERIKEFFKTKGEALTEDELERTVKAYIYLTDDRIPVGAIVVKKRSK